MGETIPFLSLNGVFKRFGRAYPDSVETRTIILFGQSMLLSLVAASLSKNDNLHVLQVSKWKEVTAFAANCHLDVLIYDLAAASESNILTLLFNNPLLLLIGLDVETNRAVLLVGKETRSLTLERVEEIVSSY